MVTVILSLIFSFNLVYSLETDPNGFFKDRSWKIEVDGKTQILAESKYLGEPVQRPNRVIATLNCDNGKPLEVLNKKYCGINYMKVVGGKLEVMFLDYSSADSRGYCTKKNIRHFDIPKCTKKRSKK